MQRSFRMLKVLTALKRYAISRSAFLQDFCKDPNMRLWKTNSVPPNSIAWITSTQVKQCRVGNQNLKSYHSKKRHLHRLKHLWETHLKWNNIWTLSLSMLAYKNNIISMTQQSLYRQPQVQPLDPPQGPTLNTVRLDPPFQTSWIATKSKAICEVKWYLIRITIMEVAMWD